MNLVDANVLIYAVDRDAEHHDAARRWLDESLLGAAPTAFAWVPLLAFVRVSTKVGLFPRPLSVAESLAQVSTWLAAPTALMIEPTSRHLEILSGLLGSVGTGGNLTNDAHLAALALEHRATIVSFDADFGRFAGVRWTRPASSS